MDKYAAQIKVESKAAELSDELLELVNFAKRHDVTFELTFPTRETEYYYLSDLFGDLSGFDLNQYITKFDESGSRQVVPLVTAREILERLISENKPLPDWVISNVNLMGFITTKVPLKSKLKEPNAVEEMLEQFEYFSDFDNLIAAAAPKESIYTLQETQSVKFPTEGNWMPSCSMRY